jgi:hypothetical protein
MGGGGSRLVCPSPASEILRVWRGGGVPICECECLRHGTVSKVRQIPMERFRVEGWDEVFAQSRQLRQSLGAPGLARKGATFNISLRFAVFSGGLRTLWTVRAQSVRGMDVIEQFQCHTRWR